MRRFDYNEPVKLMWRDLRAKSQKPETVTKSCKLGEAVRLVAENWATRRDRELEIIQRLGGKKSITTYDKVKAIYEREDFPAK
jgi:hypothetical protein